MDILPGLLFLTFSIIVGIFTVHRVFRIEGIMLFFFGSLVGIVLVSWITYLLALLLARLENPFPISASLILVFFILVGLMLFLRKQIFHILPLAFRDTKHRWVIVFIFFVFASALMIATFRYDNQNQIFLIGKFVYSDFAHHLPLIRSFSLGENVPVQHPLFGGEPIRYHFLFYFFAGLLEKGKLPIDLALNIPSIIGFAGLLVAIWYLVEVLFKKERGIIGIALTAVFLFITSSSLLAFTSFSLPDPLTLTAFVGSTFGKTEFLSGGPYYNWDNTITGLFWNLNIFTNQRHLAFGIAYGLFIFSFLFKILQSRGLLSKTTIYRTIFLGVLMGLLPFFHGLTFIAFILITILLFPFVQQKRLLLVFLIFAGIVAFPQLLHFSPQTPEAYLAWFPGYALHNNLHIDTFIEYWTKNLGLKFLALPILFIALSGMPRCVFLTSMGIFLLANLVRFGPDIYTNHKFFTIWLIFVNIAFAYLIVKLFMKNWFLKIVGVILVLILTISGLLDIPPILNASSVRIHDWERDPIASFIVHNTKPNELIATGYHIYHPATLTGRSIMLGWPYFTWSAGYPVKQRENVTRQLFETEDIEAQCQIARAYNIRYIIAGQSSDRTEPYHPAIDLLSNTFDVVASDDRYIIFDIRQTCNNLLKNQQH